ncbi:hypothetical protein DP117_33300 [Brasilonema sp. UFV-L1]|nr:hypothetical protein [Brasilonema sp. UFV-L1]
MGVAESGYEFDFVMLNVAKRNEASTEILCPMPAARLLPIGHAALTLLFLRFAQDYAQNDNSYLCSATPKIAFRE